MFYDGCSYVSPAGERGQFTVFGFFRVSAGGDFFFTVCFFGNRAHGERCFRTPCPNCHAEPSTVPAAAPRPRKRVGSGLRSQIGPLARRGIRLFLRLFYPRLPEIGTGARTSQYASNRPYAVEPLRLAVRLYCSFCGSFMRNKRAPVPYPFLRPYIPPRFLSPTPMSEWVCIVVAKCSVSENGTSHVFRLDYNKYKNNRA